MLDSPTNNFCTLNPLDANASIAISEGNTKTTHSGWQEACATFWMTTGKYYYEATLENSAGTGGSNAAIFGIVKGSKYGQSHSVIDSGRMATQSNGSWVTEGLGTAADFTGSAVTYTTGDIMSLTFDADSGELKIYKNNSLVGTSSSTSEYATATEGWKIFLGGASGNRWVANFGQDSSFAGNKTAQGNADDNGYGDFYYTPPTDFLALCTSNLPDPAVIPSEHFNTVLYAGNGTSQSITGVGFQPDFVWGKIRSGVNSHALQDVLRGQSKTLFSDAAVAESEYGTNVMSSFDSDGFSVGGYGLMNGNSATYVAWNWKAGGTGVSNTNGSITSTVSANADAGFSIVSWTGTLATGTVGTGLTSDAEFVIVKNRDTTDNWSASTTVIDGSVDGNYLNGTGAFEDWSARVDPSAATSNTIGVYNWADGNGSGNAMIAYCFHSVEGYSKVGSYTGNASADGTFVYTGFRPAYVMIKRTDTTASWNVLDSVRNPYNYVANYLYPNSSQAEVDGSTANFTRDYTANGFKLRATNTFLNANGGTYIFLAFAEVPFKFSNAR
jgi:hypothetical protein